MISLATLEAKLGAIAIGLVILALSHLGAYEYGKHAGKAVIIAADEKALSSAIIKNDDLKKQLEVDHANAQIAINTLLSATVPRVRIPLCSSQANPASGVAQTEPADRLLSEQIGAVFQAGRLRVKGLVGEAEQELIDCRVSKDWANSFN